MPKQLPVTPAPLVRLAHNLTIIAVAALLCLPDLIFGIPKGDDGDLHVMYQHFFTAQFWHGDLYPRWLAEANKGYGSPIFFVQYPFPYFTTALLRPILSFASGPGREAHELGVYCFLVLAAAGLAAAFWFRKRCSPMASTIAAIAYMAMPYVFADLYTRVAIGELAAFVWMPLLLALSDRALPLRFRNVAAIGTAFALLLCSNIILSVLFLPFLIVYAITTSRRALLPVLIGVASAGCIAAAYLFPLLAYEHFFDPRQYIVVNADCQLGRHLLYVIWDEVLGVRPCLTIPALACLAIILANLVRRSRTSRRSRIAMLVTLALGSVLLIPGVGQRLVEFSGLTVTAFNDSPGYSMPMLFSALLTFCLGVLSYSRIGSKPTRHNQDRVLLAVCCATFFAMLAWSAPFWKLIPKTEVIQFPWRLCSVLTVAVAGLFASALDDCLYGPRESRVPSPRMVYLMAIFIIAAGAFVWRVDHGFSHPDPPLMSATDSVDGMCPVFVPPDKLAGFSKIVGYPPETDYHAPTPTEVTITARFVSGNGTASVTRLGPRTLLVHAQTSGNARLVIGQLYFPLWRFSPAQDPSRGEAVGSSPDDFIELPVTAGQQDIRLEFEKGLVEKAGDITTLVSVSFILMGSIFVELRRRLRRRQGFTQACQTEHEQSDLTPC